MEDSPKRGGLDGRYQKTFSNGTIHAFDQTGTNITDDTEFVNRLAQFNRILDPDLTTYVEEREMCNLPDVSIRQAFETFRLVSQFSNR